MKDSVIQRRWIKVRWLLGSLATIAPCAAAAQSLPTSANPSTIPSPGDAPQDAQTTLQSADASQSARDMAAIRLIAWRDPAVRPVVVDILTNGSTPAKAAVSRALASVGWTDENFIAPLESLLAGRDPVPAAALALGQYTDNLQVLQALRIQAKSDRVDIREPVIRALGAFTQKPAAETLLYILQHDDSDAIREAAGNALIQMTGRSDLDHNSSLWSDWWEKNGSLSDDKFREVIIAGRGNAFEDQVAAHQTLQNAADDFLRVDFWSAAPEKQAGILLSYLQSSAPEIRALGAELVLSSAAATGTPPAGAIPQTRLLLGDPSAQVRAAAATALSADIDSAPDLIAQLAREPDDLVRVRLIKSLAPFQDVRALEQMFKLVGPGTSDPVRIAAADGIREGGDVINKDPAMKKRAIQALKDAIQGTDVPDEQTLRAAIVGALAAIHDDSLSDLFRTLLSRDEPLGVRANALVGLGNLPNSAPFAGEIGRHLDDDAFQMRLAAIQALRHPPFSPIPILYITKLLNMMNEDPNDQVRAAAWDELQYWAQLPDMDEPGISTLADGLKTQPANELLIRKKLCDRLALDVQNGANAAGNHSAAKELAEEQQTVGDLQMSSAINQPKEAADAYRAALDFWKSNQGRPDVINRLCRDIVDALLAAKRWDDAAAFAAGIVKTYGTDPNLRVTSETVGREFVSMVQNLEDSSDPGSYTDATALLDALQKMDPPLPADFPDQLASLRSAIEAKHAASSKPSP
jgi:HEAT repeat protein